MTSISSSQLSSMSMPTSIAASRSVSNNGNAFSEIINPNQATSSDGLTVHQAAEKLVSSALIMPIIQQIHGDNNFRAGVFKPGDAERRFQPMMDYYLADQIVSGANFDLTEAVVERLQSRISSKGLQA